MKKTIAILVNYNNPLDTKEAIKSLQKQSIPFYKIIITDNNSTDNSYEILQQIESDQVVLLRSNENKGFASGNNLAIRFALKNFNFDYFLIINNDTISDKNLNENFINFMEMDENENIGIVTGKILNYHKPNKLLSAGGYFSKLKCSGYHIGKNEIDNGQFDKMRECTFATACLWFFGKDLIREVGYLPEEYFLYEEDVDYCLKVQEFGLKIVYLSSAKIWHKEGSATGITKQNPNFYFTNRNRIILSKKYLSGIDKLKFLTFFFITRFFRFFQFLAKGKLINSYSGILEGLKFKI